MKYFKLLGLLALLSFSTLTSVAADEALEAYLKESDPYIVKLQNTVGEFLKEIKPLREKKDLVGLKNTADKYVKLWDGYVTELEQIEAPEEAQPYHASLTRLHELQRESNVIMSETLGYRIQVILAAREMKEKGASQEEIDTYLQANALDRDELLKKTTEVKNETQTADASMKAERKKLIAIVKPDSE